MPQAAARSQRMNDKQKLAFAALNHLAAERGKPPPAEWQLPAGLSAVPVDAWRDLLLSRGVIDKGGPNPRQDFSRLKTQLAAKDRIAERDALVWSTTKGE